MKKKKIISTQFRENLIGSQETFIKPVFFQDYFIYSYIYTSTISSRYNQIVVDTFIYT